MNEIAKMAAMCFGKKYYRSEKEARRIADKVYKERSVALRVYYCPYCGKYHLTKQTIQAGGK